MTVRTVPTSSDAEPQGTGRGLDADALERRLQSFLPYLDRLEIALAAEAEALTSTDDASLLDAVELKRRSLSELGEALQHSGLLPLLTEAVPAPWPPSWQRFIDSLARCHVLNETAGSAIACLQQHTAHSLRLLRGAPEPAAYGRTGLSEARAPGRKLEVC